MIVNCGVWTYGDIYYLNLESLQEILDDNYFKWTKDFFDGSTRVEMKRKWFCRDFIYAAPEIYLTQQFAKKCVDRQKEDYIFLWLPDDRVGYLKKT